MTDGKTKIIRPVDVDDHTFLRQRVAFLEAMFCEVVSTIADTHPEREFLMEIVGQIIPEKKAGGSHDED